MWIQKVTDKQKENAFIAKGIDRLLARILSQRDFSEADIDSFLSPDYNLISHPYSLNGIEQACDIFLKSVENKEKIAVLGDYDADGIISSSMMKELCRVFNLDCDVFLPSRLKHSYGLSEKSSNAFKAKHKNSMPDLLFLLDCGSNNFKEIEDLKASGVKKVIVIDHHIISKEKGSYNADCFINWHLSDSKQEMCTCGLVFQFIRGIRWKTKKVDPISFLTYAAIGTIADVSPIIGDNRVIVKNGLTSYALNNVPSAGLHSLIGTATLNKGHLTQDDIAFKVGPRINAVGRLYHPDLAYCLLIETDPSVADKMAEHIISCNEERKDLQKRIEAEAITKVNSESLSGVFVSDSTWHIGVLGIVASKLVETYGLPSIVVGYHDGFWRGSGRSIIGINIKEILDNCKEMFSTYGGHELACGVTINPEYIDRASEMFNAACKKYYEKHNIQKQKDNYYEASLKLDAVNEKNALTLSEKLAPYCGEKNPEPIFQLKDVIIVDPEIKEYKGGKYVVLKLKIHKNGKTLEYPFISFSLSKKFGTEIDGKKMNVYFKFPQSSDSKFELQLVDLEFAT